MSIRAVFERTVDETPGCMALTYVDLTSSQVLEYATTTVKLPDLEAMARVAGDLFDLRNMAILSLYQLTGAAGTLLQHNPVQEMLFRVRPWLHVLLRYPGERQRALVVTFEQDVQVGVALTEARFAMRASARAEGGG